MHKKEKQRSAASCIPAAGFTLVELLVVLAIVGLLAAILIGAVSRAKKHAQNATCQNNLKQIGLGFAQFVETFNEYPLANNRRGFKQGLYQHHGIDWYEALNLNVFELPFAGRNPVGYTKASTDGVWDCPSAHRPGEWDDDPIRKGNLWGDYGYNEYGLGNHGNAYLGLGGVGDKASAVGYRPTPEGDVRSPAEMIEAGDGIIGWETNFSEGPFVIAIDKRVMSPPSSYDTSYDTPRALSRHNGRANVVFCDGHVESIKLSSLFTVQSSAALVRWNKDHQAHPEMLY